MKKHLLIPLILIALAVPAILAGHPRCCQADDPAPAQPLRDFPFVTVSGDTVSLAAIAAESKASRLQLLLFDPDCDHCIEVIDSLRADSALSREIAAGLTEMVAVYAADEPPTPDNPNYQKYARVAPLLPQEWTVGTDNGYITDNDLYLWDELPLLLTSPLSSKCPH